MRVPLECPACVDNIFAPDGTWVASLFQTLHCEGRLGDYTLDGPIYDRISRCDVVVSEVALTEVDSLPRLDALPGAPWSASATPDQAMEIRAAYEIAGADPGRASQDSALQGFLRLYHAFWWARWTMDEAALVVAHRLGREVIGLETGQEQIRYLMEVPEDEWLTSLIDLTRLLRRGPSACAAMKREIELLYQEGRMGELLERAVVRTAFSGARRILIDQRDQLWFDRILPLCSGRRLFVVVGAAHGPGLKMRFRESGFRVSSDRPGWEKRLSLRVSPTNSPVSWPIEIEREASRMLSDAPIVSALCTPGAQDTRTPVFTSPGNLARKGLGSAPAPNLFWFVSDPCWNPLEFEDSYTSVTIEDRRELVLGGWSVRLTRLRCGDKQGSKLVLGSREVVVAQLAASGWSLYQTVREGRWHPAMVVAMGREAQGSFTSSNVDGWVRAMLDAASTRGRELHLLTDDASHLPPLCRHRRHHRAGARLRLLGRLSRRWGRSTSTLRGATLFRLAPASVPFPPQPTS